MLRSSRCFRGGLHLIDQLLSQSNKLLKDFPPMPLSQTNWAQIVGNRLITEQRDYNAEEQQRLADEHIQMQINKRLSISSWMSSTINLETVFSLETGKIFAYKTLCYALCGQGLIISTCLQPLFKILPLTINMCLSQEQEERGNLMLVMDDNGNIRLLDYSKCAENSCSSLITNTPLPPD
jgi:hypothetical protein